MYGGFRGAGTVAAPSEDQFRDFCRGLGKEMLLVLCEDCVYVHIICYLLSLILIPLALTFTSP